jgi:integrase/recombinase XerD
MGHINISSTYWYLSGVPELMALAGARFERFADSRRATMSSPDHRKPASPSFGTLVQSFFAEHMTQQRALSPQTVAAYRDAFVLFLDFAQARLHKTPTTLSLADLTPALILDFLDHLERDRHNTVRSRNARLAALRSFLKFAAHET